MKNKRDLVLRWIKNKGQISADDLCVLCEITDNGLRGRISELNKLHKDELCIFCISKNPRVYKVRYKEGKRTSIFCRLFG